MSEHILGGMSDLTIPEYDPHPVPIIETSGHLPECPCATAPEYTVRLCVCARLRACEQRIARTREGNGELWLDGYGTGWHDGHTFALDAAREAVAGLPIKSNGVAMAVNVLAAIDALREGKQ